jgi:hypothetical protein
LSGLTWHGDTPAGGFGVSSLSNAKIAPVPLALMATKIGKVNVTDTAFSYLVSGVIAFLVLLLAGKAGWTLWVIGPAAGLMGFYLIHSPRRQRRKSASNGGRPNGVGGTDVLPAKVITKTPKARGVISSRDDRHPGWNALGALTVRPDDPYIVIKGESPPDGVSVSVAPGRWLVHVRSELVAKAPVHMRDAEVRVVQDSRWVTEDWDWTPTWEPLLTGHLGSTAQSGRIAVDAGLLRVQAGRRGRSRATSRAAGRTRNSIILQPGFAEGAFGVNVVRDLAGNVVAIVSRFG